MLCWHLMCMISNTKHNPAREAFVRMTVGFISLRAKHLRYLNSVLLVTSQVGVPLQATVQCVPFSKVTGAQSC